MRIGGAALDTGAVPGPGAFALTQALAPTPAPTPARSAPGAAPGAVPAPRPVPPQPYAVEVATEVLDLMTGVRHRAAVVGDESDASPTRDAAHAEIALLDDLLRANPAWPAPCVRPDSGEDRVHTDGNPVGQWLYASEALREWRRELVPSALALLPVQRDMPCLPSGAPVDRMARRVLRDSLDAIGIRSRARVMADIVRRTSHRLLAEDERAGRAGPLEWVSLACGAAVPVLDAMAALPAGAVHLSLVDVDPRALAFARALAGEQHLVEGLDFAVLERNLVRGLVVGGGLVDELGEGRAAVVEALGIFEYFTDASCVRLLRGAARLVRPDGALVVGNMLADRRELAFNQRGAGWPRLYPRSVADLVELVRRAGLPLDRTTVTVPQDGVYAVVDVRL